MKSRLTLFCLMILLPITGLAQSGSNVTIRVNLTNLQTITLEDACGSTQNALSDSVCTVTSPVYTVSILSSSPFRFSVEDKGHEKQTNTRILKTSKNKALHKETIQPLISEEITPINNLLIDLTPVQPQNMKEATSTPSKIRSNKNSPMELLYTMSVR